MRQILLILKHLLFFMCLFVIGRTCFLIANVSLLEDVAWTEILNTYVAALQLDFSTACYMTAVPLLFVALHWAFPNKWWMVALKIYAIVVILLFAVILFSEIAIYSEWATKLNYKALHYLEHPAEIVQSASGTHIAIVLIGVPLFAAAGIWTYLKWIMQSFQKLKITRSYWAALLLFLLGEPLLFAGVRGGFQQIPVSQSSAYFSKCQILNDAAVNPGWNIGHSLLNFSKLNNENPFIVMSDEEVAQCWKEMNYMEKDTTLFLLKNDSVPINVVIILLESWSADLIESLTGAKGITPNFHQLEKEGVLFTRFYANGHRSQLGISALLSGFPVIPDNSITDNFEKYSKLNSLVKDLNQAHYYTSFYFGGDLAYGNLKAYLTSNQFDKIVDENGFPKDLPHGKLSIFDQYTFPFHLQALQEMRQPFFSILFTASTHSPYDEPKIVPQIVDDEVELPYRNSAKYTDHCLGQYFAAAKKEPWYEHTLFILVADHSHQTQYKRDYYTSDYQRVPMLWIGGALKEEYRGTTIDKVASHIDIAPTLLHQLHIDCAHYGWSKNILNPYAPEYMTYEIPGGLGWTSRNGYLRYEGFSKTYPTIRDYAEQDSEIVEKEKKWVAAFLQKLYSEYLAY